MSSALQLSPVEWDRTYNVVRLGRARYRLPIKSVIALRVGYKFWIPIRRSMLVHSAFVRPVWKPRNGPNHLLVQVVRVDGDELMLRRLQPPIEPRVKPELLARPDRRHRSAESRDQHDGG